MKDSNTCDCGTPINNNKFYTLTNADAEGFHGIWCGDIGEYLHFPEGVRWCSWACMSNYIAKKIAA